MNEVTLILSDLAQGNAQAAGQLLPLVYEELRKLAAARMAEEAPGHTLNATALVHEVYLRLVEPAEAARWDHRGHFFAAAAEAMRRILVEAARRKQRAKHGGGRQRLDLDAVQPAAPDDRPDKATPAITWATPAAITFGTALHCTPTHTSHISAFSPEPPAGWHFSPSGGRSRGSQCASALLRQEGRHG